MSISSRSFKNTSGKRVSFEDTVEQTFEESRKDKHHSIEISEMFPNINAPSILRSTKMSPRSIAPMSEDAKRFLNRRKKRRAYSNPNLQGKKQKSTTPRNELLPHKEPTESLAHALLRAMTHQVLSRRSKVILPKLTILSDRDTNLTLTPQSQSSRSNMTPRSLQSTNSTSGLKSQDFDDKMTSFSYNSFRTLPEIIPSVNSNETQVFKLDRVCGICRRNWRLNNRPAAGFCKICDEYMCGECVINHRRPLTRLHPVVVFYCDTCKEMNILNKKGSGYCVKCKHFYCTVCVLLHCSETNHDVLEGNDLLDVTDVLIGKK